MWKLSACQVRLRLSSNSQQVKQPVSFHVSVVLPERSLCIITEIVHSRHSDKLGTVRISPVRCDKIHASRKYHALSLLHVSWDIRN